MTPSTLPLKTLAEQLAQHQAELETLHQEFQARQARLDDLTQRKADMESQLRQLDQEIETVHGGASSPSPVAPAETPRTKPVQPPPRPRSRSLADLLLKLVRRAPGPITVKELAVEVKRRKFPSRSKNLPHLIHVGLQKLIARGVLQRAPGHPGVIPARAEEKTPASQAQASPRGKKKEKAKAKTASPATPGVGKKPALRLVLTELLKKSPRPLVASALAEQVLAQGYQTRSKDFTTVVWATLANLDHVENVPGQGYRLKKR